MSDGTSQGDGSQSGQQQSGQQQSGQQQSGQQQSGQQQSGQQNSRPPPPPPLPQTQTQTSGDDVQGTDDNPDLDPPDDTPDITGSEDNVDSTGGTNDDVDVPDDDDVNDMSGDGGDNQEISEEEAKKHFERVFRYNLISTKADLRLIVAGAVQHSVAGDETLRLKERTMHSRSTLNVVRKGNRTRTVNGKYEHHVGTAYANMVDSRIDEKVTGVSTVDLYGGLDVIIAGPYINTIAGGALKLCAWSDYLCWGGWLECDTVRVEIAAVMLRSHMYYAHATILRLGALRKLVDDYCIRTEKWGTLHMTAQAKLNALAPGGGVLQES